MNFSHLRSQVDALCRRYATELAMYRNRAAADEYCDQWQELVDQEQLPPDPVRLFGRLPASKSNGHRIPAIHKYLDRCRIDSVLPHPNEILRRLFPDAAKRRLIPRELQPVPY